MQDSRLPNGIVVALLTPLNSEREVDYDAFDRIVDHVASNGCSGVFGISSSGEYLLMNREQRDAATEALADICAKRHVPLMVNVTDYTPGDVADNIARYREYSPAGYVTMMPMVSQLSGEQQKHFLHEAARISSEKIMLYNHPFFPNTLSNSNLDELIQEGVLCGMKHSSHELYAVTLALEVTSKYPEFAAYLGAEPFAGLGFMLPFKGLTLAMANMAPGVFSELYRAGKAGDAGRVAKLQNRMMKLFELVHLFGEHIQLVDFILTLKMVMKVLGLCEITMTFPTREPTSEDYRKLEGLMRESGIA